MEVILMAWEAAQEAAEARIGVACLPRGAASHRQTRRKEETHSAVVDTIGRCVKDLPFLDKDI